MIIKLVINLHVAPENIFPNFWHCTNIQYVLRWAAFLWVLLKIRYYNANNVVEQHASLEWKLTEKKNWVTYATISKFFDKALLILSPCPATSTRPMMSALNLDDYQWAYFFESISFSKCFLFLSSWLWITVFTMSIGYIKAALMVLMVSLIFLVINSDIWHHMIWIR